MARRSGPAAQLMTTVPGRDEPPASPRAQVQRQTMGAQVADALRLQIMSGELPEGHQLRQEQLASEFGISKVPVREALNLLEAEGLVVQQFHKGAVVAGLSLDQIMQAFELRALIEVWLIGSAVAAASPADVEEAASRAKALEACQDPAQLPRLNWQFHEALYKPAGKDHVLDMVRKLHLQVERFVKMQFSLAVQFDDVVVEHRDLLDLYARRDMLVQARLRQHIMGSAERLTGRLATFRDAAKTRSAKSKR